MTRYRALGVVIATASNWIFTCLIAFFTPFITAAIGFTYGYVFGGFRFMAEFVVYFFLIESTGWTLEEIDTMYLLRVKPWASRTWVHPNANPSRDRKTTLDGSKQHKSEDLWSSRQAHGTAVYEMMDLIVVSVQRTKACTCILVLKYQSFLFFLTPGCQCMPALYLECLILRCFATLLS